MNLGSIVSSIANIGTAGNIVSSINNSLSSALIGAGVKARVISNANLFMGGNSLVGTCEKVTGAYDFKHKYDDYKALGLLSSFPVWVGMEPAEMKLSFTSFYEDVFAATMNPVVNPSFQLRASITTVNAAGMQSFTPLVVFFAGAITEASGSDNSPAEKAKTEKSCKPIYKKIVVGGKNILEWDAINNIFKINNQPVFVDMLSNMGV